MGESAHVESTEALREFRVALAKFVEACNSALSDAEGDLRDTLNWLENEQFSHWQGQIRKRQDLLDRAKEALRMKRLFKDSTGRTPQAVEEEKAVRLCQARVEEAEQKLQNVKKYTRVLQKEIDVYKGGIQRFSTSIQSDIPVAMALLDKWATTLEAYISLAASEIQPSAPHPQPSSANDVQNTPQ